MKPSHDVSKILINETHKVWQPRLPRNLTDEDARQIAKNITGFFALLTEWSQAETLTSVNDRAVAGLSNYSGGVP